MTLTLDQWTTDPDAVVDAIFAPDGPLSRAMPNYVRNDFQVEYTKILARAATRGAGEDKRGLVAAVEAGTGIGKSVSILIVAGVTAILRKRRALVTTYTRLLNRQIAGKDGDIAAKVVTEVTGVELKIAVRRPRSAFAGPRACRRHAGLIRTEANAAIGDEKAEKFATADALVALADWSEEAYRRAETAVASKKTRAFTRTFDALIETFLVGRDAFKGPLATMPYDLFTLDSGAREDEQVAWRVYDDETKDAHVIVATHAALIRDQSQFGSTLDPDGQGFSIVIADEANRLEEAGRLALGTKRALSSFRREMETIQPVAASKAAEGVRQALTITAMDQVDTAESMLAKLATVAVRAMARREREIDVHGDEPWVAELQTLADGAAKLLHLLKDVKTSDAAAVASRLRARQTDLETFFDCIRREKASKGNLPGIELAPADRSYARASLSFTPYVGEPSILVKPKRGARVLKRLWDGKEGPRLDAFVATSATLGMPGRRGVASFSSLLNTIGVDQTSPRLATDLCTSVEMTDFGTMRRLVLADPKTPLPSRKGEEAHLEGSHRNPEWANYVVDAVVDASAETWREDERSHVVVLCTGFDEAAALGALATERLGDVVHVRGRDRGVDDGFDWLAGTKKGVLFTVGAFDGVDRPRQIDHLVIPRIPHPHQRGKFYRAFVGKDGTVHEAPMVEEATIMLKQGLGRPFRSVDDEAVVWILDPRIGLPPSSTLIAHEKSNANFLAAVPRRFSKALRAAQIRPFNVEKKS